MKLTVLWIAGLMLAGTGFAIPNAAHGAMVTFNNGTSAILDNWNGVSAFDIFSSTSFPTSHLVNATAEDYYSRIQVDYAQSGSGETLSSHISQRKDGDQYDISYGESYTHFSVTSNTTYNLSGYHDVLDATTSGQVYLYTYLYDATNGIYLTQDVQLSETTLNETFAVGGAGGDSSNHSTGSLSGNLVAGNVYEFYWGAYIQSYPDVDGGASAVGNFTLVLGHGAAAVPEPASFAMWGLATLDMMFARRKRRQIMLAA